MDDGLRALENRAMAVIKGVSGSQFAINLERILALQISVTIPSEILPLNIRYFIVLSRLFTTFGVIGLIDGPGVGIH